MMNSKTAVYTSDKEDKELLSRVDDAVFLSSLRHKPVFLGFLNEREQYIISEYLSYSPCEISSYGGYEGAQRKIISFSEYPLEKEDFPVKALYFKFRDKDKLSHRDFLGSLMSLGIERSFVGDIIVNDGAAVCFIKNDIAPYVESQISKIGRVGVRIVSESECDIDFVKDTEVLSVIASSMRLDVIVAALTGLSRDKTSKLIISGKVFVNYAETKNVSHFLKINDILTIRGSGKFVIKDQLGQTKKGRLKINIEHYR